MKLLAKDAQKPYYELRQYMSYQVKRIYPIRLNAKELRGT